MRTPGWRVEWRACPRPDGAARLAHAVRLVLEAGTRPPKSAVGPTGPRWRAPRLSLAHMGQGETR